MTRIDDVPGGGPLRAALLSLRFLLELALLVVVWAGVAALVDWSLVGSFVATVVALAVAGVWAAFGSPAAPYRLADPARLGLELSLFAVGVVALLSLGAVELAVTFGLLSLTTAVAVRNLSPPT